MHSTQKLEILKKLLIIVFFFTCIPITIIYVLLRDISSVNFLIDDYFTSGYSLFFPFLPYSNIIFKFSTGHLIDLIIIVNIIAILERSGYTYYVNVCLKKDYFDSQYLNIYFLESEENQNSRIPKLNLIFRFNNELDDLFEEEVQECESEKHFKLISLFKKESAHINKTRRLLNPECSLPIIYGSSLNKHPNLFLNTFYFSIPQNLRVTNFHNNHLPPKNNYYFFNSNGGSNFAEILQIIIQNLSNTNKISKKSE
jgi:hypothetical protein